MAIKGQLFFKAAWLVVAGPGLSGCVYDVDLSLTNDGYYDDVYGCDAYGGYEPYYNCDYEQAFSNIDFGGGWYDNYFYSGYGISLFDDPGRRIERCASNLAAIEVSGATIGIASIVAVIGTAAPTMAVIGVARRTQGPKDKDRRIIKDAGCMTVTTKA